MTIDLTAEEYRALKVKYAASLQAVNNLAPEHALHISDYVSETERRYRTLASSDLLEAMIFDLFALLAVNAKALDKLDAGTLRTIIQIEADRSALALLEAQEKAAKRSAWADNWKLILSSGGIGGLLIAGALALAQTLLGGSTP